MTHATATWTAPGGSTINFEVYPIGTAFNSVSGVYIFAKPAANGNWDPVYIGEAANLNERLNTGLQSHHAWPNIRLHGASHLLVTKIRGARDNRLALETALRHAFDPVCNRQ